MALKPYQGGCTTLEKSRFLWGKVEGKKKPEIIGNGWGLNSAHGEGRGDMYWKEERGRGEWHQIH